MSKPSDEFITPPACVELAKKILGRIDYDPYSCKGQLIPARDGLSLASDPEAYPETGNWWANIPFSESRLVLERLTMHFAAHRNINALVLSLATPSAVYWRKTMWSAEFGPRRIAWIPRLSFYQLDSTGVARPTAHDVSRDICLSLWTDEPLLVSRFEREVARWHPKTPKGETRPIHVQTGGRP